MKTNTLDFDAQTLREKILDLVMRGKLVPQDPDDEPASVLLEKIKAEKEELIKEKKIKKSKPLPEITDDEKPFEIPDSWEWVRFGDVVTFSLGKTPKRADNKYWHKGDVPWVSVSDLGKEKFLLRTKESITSKALNDVFKGRLAPSGTLLMSFKLSIGKVGILNMAAVHNEAIISINPIIDINHITRDYLYYVLPILSNKSDYTPAIKGKTLNKTLLNDLIVPLPPLSEQSRIAAKIAQLFALLRKVESSIQQYANLKDLLKSKLLGLAMRGKLVEQDSTDESANVLLDRIKVERDQLIKEKKIKKTKSLAEISDDEKPFDIPNSWKWVRLGDVVSIKGGKRVPKGKKLVDYQAVRPYIRVTDMKEYTVSTNDLKYVTQDVYDQIKKYTISSNDIYFSIAGTIGKVGKVPDKVSGALLTENAAKLTPYDANKDFLIQALSSNIVEKQHKKILSQVAQPKLSLIKLRQTIIPLPPLSEQRRIVSKLEQLFALIS